MWWAWLTGTEERVRFGWWASQPPSTPVLRGPGPISRTRAGLDGPAVARGADLSWGLETLPWSWGLADTPWGTSTLALGRVP